MGSSVDDHSASVSAGANTHTDSSGTQTDQGSHCLFEEGEKVLAFHNPQFYEAKVIKVEYKSEGWQCFVHYLGWNKNWDEWLGIEWLEKYNDKNVQEFLPKKQDLEKNARAVRSHIKAKGGGAKKRKKDSLDKASICFVVFQLLGKWCYALRKVFESPISTNAQLVEDCEFITHLGKLVKLPRSPNVDMIMKKYLDYRLKKDGLISEADEEITKGLCCYFNKALPVILLYKSEREQYDETIKDGISPSAVYGAEHLLRLFVKLPELLTYANIDEETLVELQQK